MSQGLKTKTATGPLRFHADGATVWQLAAAVFKPSFHRHEAGGDGAFRSISVLVSKPRSTGIKPDWGEFDSSAKAVKPPG
jgi:hypothetical protein